MNNNFLPYQIKKTNDSNESLASQLADNAKKIIYPEKYGAMGDGLTDDFNAIQTMFNSIDDNSIVVFKGGKNYLLGDGTAKENEVKLTNRKGIKIYGYGATLTQKSNNPATQTTAGNTIGIYTSSGIEIYGLTIEGGNQTRTYVDSLQIVEKGNGIRIFASSNIIVKDCTLNHNLVDGILVVGAYDGNNCDNIKILNTTCDNNSRQGISVAEATNVLIDGGTMSNTGLIQGLAPKAGIDIEPNGYTDTYIDQNAPTGQGSDKRQRKFGNVLIRNVTFINNAGGDLKVQYFYPKNVKIENCTLNDFYGIQTEDLEIRHNNINKFSFWGDNKNIRVKDNIINDNNVSMTNIFYFEATNVALFENNTIKNASNITDSLIKMTGSSTLATSPRNITFLNNTFPSLNYTTLVSTNSFLWIINGFDNIVFKGNTIIGNSNAAMLSQLFYVQYVLANTDCDKRIYFMDNFIDCKNSPLFKGNNAGVVYFSRNDIRNCQYIAYVDRVAATYGTYKDFIMSNNKVYLNSNAIMLGNRAVYADISNYKLDFSSNNFFNTSSGTSLSNVGYFGFVQCSGYFSDNVVEDGCIVPYIFNHFSSIITYIRNAISTKGNDFAALNSSIAIQNYKLNGTINQPSNNSRGSTGSRPTNVIYAGYPYFDTTLNKPIWCKTVGVTEIDTLTISAGASTAGNITITLNGVAITVSVAAGDSTGTVGDKIRATTFTGWTVGGTAGSSTVTFTKQSVGTNTASAFADTGTTGTAASFAVTTAGTNNVWVDATSTTV